MITKTIALTVIGFGLLLSTLAPRVMAQNCTTSYGGQTTCTPAQIVIVKEVQNPITGAFVKNLSTTDATFSPDGNVLFRLTIKNTGSSTLDPVTVKDIFPKYLTFASGPGTYDASSKTLTFILNNLLSGESRQVQVMAKIDPLSSFPSGQNFFCEVNDSLAQASGLSAEDTAQLCIQTNVLGATTLPVAGTNDWMLILPFLALAGTGLVLAKIKS